MRQGRGLTPAELAAFLGVTSHAVRKTIRKHRILSTGRDGKAFLYDAQQVLEHTGSHDRRSDTR